ncbi:unnamed protein product [Nippostrongylus brasiliensis]|uniref:Uncharacterized protein n=1 Tax=Nippostrongylus brasiliensis TaxID=27835 RepID=A0A0N4Y1P4_NIPBR|nr:unnamed protein product [Nippostrongylus brasiliensis]
MTVTLTWSYGDEEEEFLHYREEKEEEMDEEHAQSKNISYGSYGSGEHKRLKPRAWCGVYPALFVVRHMKERLQDGSLWLDEYREQRLGYSFPKPAGRRGRRGDNRVSTTLV